MSKVVKNMNFNEFINFKRKQLNLSVDDLVRISGIPKGTLSKITAGINTNPKLSTIEALCIALNCSLDEAINFKNNCIQMNNIENDDNKKKLIHNYELMNENARHTLVEYSDFMVSKRENLKDDYNCDKMNA